MQLFYNVLDPISTNRCAREKLEVANECRCCSEVGPAVGKLGFDGSIETISCITKHGGYKAITHEEMLKLTGPMLRDKNGRSYKR